MGAGLLQGFPVDASLSRSAVGAGAGVRTRLSGLFVALLIVATMLFLTPLFDGLPQATLAAIIIAAVIGLVDVSGFRWLWRIDQARRPARDRGVRSSRAARRAARHRGRRARVAARADPARLPAANLRPRPRPDEASADENYQFRSVDRHPEYETIPGLVLFRFSNELFFANASYFRDETLRLVDESDPPARTVLVDASVISHADTTALAMLDDLLDQLELRGVTLEFARARTDLTDLFDRTGISDRVGPERVPPLGARGCRVVPRRPQQPELR